jgi:predicted metalloprotease
MQSQNILDPGDVDEGLNAAAAVGDDRIQAQTTGRVNPDRFTHGSAQQRATWFKRGFSSGDPNSCNTFGST